MEITDVFGVLRRHWILLTVIVLFGTVGGFTLSRLQGPIYWAEALIVIGQEINASPIDEGEEIPAEWLVGTERDIIRSRAMLGRALERLAMPPPKAAESIFGKVAAWVSPPEAPAEEPYFAEQIDHVEGALEIGLTQGSLALSLRYGGPSPEFSAAFVNTLVEAYVDDKETAFATARKAALGNLKERADHFSEEIDQTIRTVGSLVREPNSQILIQRRQQGLSGFQEILEVLEMQSLNLALTPNTQRVWFVSPATVPFKPDLSRRWFTIAVGAVLPAAIAVVLLIARAQFLSKAAPVGPADWAGPPMLTRALAPGRNLREKH